MWVDSFEIGKCENKEERSLLLKLGLKSADWSRVMVWKLFMRVTPCGLLSCSSIGKANLFCYCKAVSKAILKGEVQLTGQTLSNPSLRSSWYVDSPRASTSVTAWTIHDSSWWYGSWFCESSPCRLQAQEALWKLHYPLPKSISSFWPDGQALEWEGASSLKW
jgi:hypothetical protein